MNNNNRERMEEGNKPGMPFFTAVVLFSAAETFVARTGELASGSWSVSKDGTPQALLAARAGLDQFLFYRRKAEPDLGQITG